MLGPILKGRRVTLIPPRAEFIARWCGWFADVEVTRYLQKGFVPTPKGEADWLEAQAKNRDSVLWSILVGGKMIGSSGLVDINWRHRHAQSGTVIGEKSYWGRGYAKETMALRTHYAFVDLGLERIETMVVEGNEASRGALMATGYRHIGTRHRQKYFEGRWHDEWLGEILRSDWERAHAAAPRRKRKL